LVNLLEIDYLVKYGSRMASQNAPSARMSSRSGRTRAALITAGLDLLVDRPIDAIAIDEVVARAGVAKGSFFNHFTDKHHFAAAVAAEVRMEVEADVTRANAGVTDPVARIAGGMRVAATFALAQPRRATLLLRSQVPATRQTHPLNRGLKEDIEAALAEGLLRPEAGHVGLAYWLGLCQVLMIHLIETSPAPEPAAARLEEMLVLGLTGLGVPADHAAAIAGNAASTAAD
jgi:AcrR family transcriptional regulator